MPDQNLPHRRSLRLSPWLLAGGAVILGFAVLATTLWNTQQEKERMIQSLTARGAALIWALEAGSRTHMALRAGNPYMQLLLEESAKQPDIAYMAITDEQGRIVAHSARSEGELSGPEDAAGLNASDSPQWRIVEHADGRRIFEVYKSFSPLPGFRGHRQHRFGRRMPGELSRRRTPFPFPMPPAGGMDAVPAPGPDSPRRVCPQAQTRRVIFAGLDAHPLEEALDSDLRSAVINSLLVGLAAFGGFVSLFWAHNYRVSRRLLQDARAFASEMVGSLPLGLLSCDAGGKIALANGTAADLLGVKRRALPGTLLRDLAGLDWEDIPAALERGEEVLERETDLRLPDGSARPVSLSASRIVNEDGLFLGYLFIMRDLEEIRRLREQLRRSERLSALGNLAAGVAHEIRNPLGSIKGFAVFLQGKTARDSPEAGAAQMLVREVERLNRVVSGLLEFARPDTASLAPAELAPIVRRALRLCAPDLESKSVRVRFAPDERLPALMLDEDKLTQALLNLFLNAVQAMDKGGEISITITPDPASGKVFLRIADTGGGIAPEALSSIFDPYVTGRADGTGLGLALVHRIMEQHGGAISVESEAGKGSVFTAALPLRDA